MHDRFPRLFPAQVCFVVADVAQAIREGETQFGWGPFQQFEAPVENANYRDWRGKKTTEVALGMAGDVQVEFLHVHEGHDAVAAYQAEYGSGFQHLGISCKSRDEAITALESIGATVDVKDEFPGIRFAFVDVPTGPAMFVLLENTAPPPGMEKNHAHSSNGDGKENALLKLNRATIVTGDMAASLEFYVRAFGWPRTGEKPAVQNLDIKGQRYTAQRFLAQAGQLELELIQPLDHKNTIPDPYSAHLKRGEHGLIHAGGCAQKLSDDAAVFGEWLETGEKFALQHWAGGRNALQIRLAP